jgi:palmitoyltransferase ZDHHC9/14/18
LQRNYRTFLLFIYTTTIYIMWTFGVSMGMLFVKHGELLKEAGGNENAGGNGIWLQTLGRFRVQSAC